MKCLLPTDKKKCEANILSDAARNVWATKLEVTRKVWYNIKNENVEAS